MPSASARLRKFAEINFGGINDAPVIEALERRGFVLTREWTWQRKQIPNKFEWDCINFLIGEWDFGGYDEN